MLVSISLALVAAVAVGTIAVVAGVTIMGRRHAAELDGVTSLLEHRPAMEGSANWAESLTRLQRASLTARQQADAGDAERVRLEQAIGAVSHGVLIADDGGQIVFRNAAADAFAGARHSEALVEAEMGELLSSAVDGLGVSRTVDLFGPPRRTVVLTALPLHSDQGTGALGIIEDISELRHLEAVRRDFVANISHELKTPVGAIGLLAETLMAEEDTDVVDRLAQRIQIESFRVARTIDDLLELSRIESSEAPEREQVPVQLVMAEATERIRPAAEQVDIAVEMREPSAQLAVLGDRRQLVSAVFNLLDNAVKYSDAGSEVSVYAATDGIQVAITVEDHGIGIPARDIERIFERFYRVDQARSRQTGGTGLGLAIVRHVMGNHHGEVLVESRLGEGSSFTLTLPTASGPVALDQPMAEAG